MIEFKKHLFEVELWMGPSDLPLTPEEIFVELEREEKEFLIDFTVDGGIFLSPVQEKEILAWQNSAAGKEVEKRMGDEILEVFAKMKKTGLAAHDLRHMLLTSWETWWELNHVGALEDWRKWAIIGELTHDWGHVVEVKLEELYASEGREITWGNELHGRLSFYIVKKFLTGFPEMPKKLQELILYAVGNHSGLPGQHDVPGEISALVQNSDRSQLISYETFYRLLQSEVNSRGFALKMELNEEEKVRLVPGRQRAQPNFPVALEFFWRNVALRGEENAEHMTKMKKDLGRILYLLVGEAEREQIFYPEMMVYDWAEIKVEDYPEDWKKLMSREIWEACKVELTEEEAVFVGEIMKLGIRDFLGTSENAELGTFCVPKVNDENGRKAIRDFLGTFWWPEGSANSEEETEKLITRMEKELQGEDWNDFKKATGLFLLLKEKNEQEREQAAEMMKKKGQLENPSVNLLYELRSRYLV